MLPASPRRPVGGGFRVTQGNAGYNRHIDNLAPQPAPPYELSLEQLEKLTMEQLRHSSCLYAKRGPYVYAEILPDLPKNNLQLQEDSYDQQAWPQQQQPLPPQQQTALSTQQHPPAPTRPASLTRTLAASGPPPPAAAQTLVVPPPKTAAFPQVAAANETAASASMRTSGTLPAGPCSYSAHAPLASSTGADPGATDLANATLKPAVHIPSTSTATSLGAPQPPTTAPAPLSAPSVPTPAASTNLAPESQAQNSGTESFTFSPPITPGGATSSTAQLKPPGTALSKSLPTPPQASQQNHPTSTGSAAADDNLPYGGKPLDEGVSVPPFESMASDGGPSRPKPHEQDRPPVALSPTQQDATEELSASSQQPTATTVQASVAASATSAPPTALTVPEPLPTMGGVQSPGNPIQEPSDTYSNGWQNYHYNAEQQHQRQPPAVLQHTEQPTAAAECGLRPETPQDQHQQWHNEHHSHQPQHGHLHHQQQQHKHHQRPHQQQQYQHDSQMHQHGYPQYPHQQQQSQYQPKSMLPPLHMDHNFPTSSMPSPQPSLAAHPLPDSNTMSQSHPNAPTYPAPTPGSLAPSSFPASSLPRSHSQLPYAYYPLQQLPEPYSTDPRQSYPPAPAIRSSYSPTRLSQQLPSPASRLSDDPAFRLRQATGPFTQLPASPRIKPTSPNGTPIYLYETLPAPSLDLGFCSPSHSQEFSPRRPASPQPQWGVDPGMRSPPKLMQDDIHSGCVHHGNRNSRSRHGSVCRSRTSLKSGLRTSAEHAYPPGTTLDDVLVYQQAQTTQPAQQLQQLSRDQQQQMMGAQVEVWQHLQQQQQHLQQYPFSLWQKPLSGNHLGASDSSERQLKHGLYASRQALSSDLKLQRTLARVLKAEHARLAQETAALERLLDSYSQGLLSPEIIQARIRSLQSRLQHLADSTPLISSHTLPQRELVHADDHSTSASQAELILRVLHLVKQLPSDHGQGPHTPAEACQKTTHSVTQQHQIADHALLHPPQHAHQQSHLQRAPSTPLPSATDSGNLAPPSTEGHWLQHKGAGVSRSADAAGTRAGCAGCIVDADGLVHISMPKWKAEATKQAPTPSSSQLHEGGGHGLGKARVMKHRPKEQVSSKGHSNAEGCQGSSSSSGSSKNEGGSDTVGKSTSGATKRYEEEFFAAKELQPGKGTPFVKSQGSKEPSSAEEQPKSSKKEEMKKGKKEAASFAATPDDEALTPPPPPAPGTRIMLNPSDRGAVPVVQPVLFSTMSSPDRCKYADWQLGRPPHHGAAHEVFEAARHPVPYFEHTPARTNIRLTMSPSTPYWEKPEVLRQAEDMVEDQKQREQDLQQPRFLGMPLDQAHAILDEEAREEEQALQLNGRRTKELERQARAAWAREQEFQPEAVLKQKEYQAAKAERRQQEQLAKGGNAINHCGSNDNSSSESESEEGDQVPKNAEAKQHQQQAADYGAYTHVSPSGSIAAEHESPSFVQIAHSRTVRDRELAIEKAYFDLHLRRLDDVQPLGWHRADYELKHNECELERMIKEGQDEQAAEEEAAKEADEEADLQATAVHRLRKKAAAEARALSNDEWDNKGGSKQKNNEDAPGEDEVDSKDGSKQKQQRDEDLKDAARGDGSGAQKGKQGKGQKDAGSKVSKANVEQEEDSEN